MSDSTPSGETVTTTTSEVAGAWFARLGAGDIEKALALCSGDVEFINYKPLEGYNTAMPWIGTFHGREATRASFERYVSVADVKLEELVSLTVEDDRAVGVVHEVAEVRATGKTFEIEFIQMLTVRAGKIVRWKSYTDPSPILKALAS